MHNYNSYVDKINANAFWYSSKLPPQTMLKVQPKIYVDVQDVNRIPIFLLYVLEVLRKRLN